MNKSANALAGLLGCYGDSGDESDDGGKSSVLKGPAVSAMPPPGMIPSVLAKPGIHSNPPPPINQTSATSQGSPMPLNKPSLDAAGSTIHPAPIAHCREFSFFVCRYLPTFIVNCRKNNIASLYLQCSILCNIPIPTLLRPRYRLSIINTILLFFLTMWVRR